MDSRWVFNSLKKSLSADARSSFPLGVLVINHSDMTGAHQVGAASAKDPPYWAKGQSGHSGILVPISERIYGLAQDATPDDPSEGE